MSTRATAYLIVQARRAQWGKPNPETGLRGIEDTRIAGARANRPAKLERDQIAVKITVDVPDAAFEPLTPSAVVTVPTELTQRGPIDVDAVDANDEVNP